MMETINGLREIAAGSQQVTKAMETLASVTANVKTSGGGMSEQVTTSRRRSRRCTRRWTPTG
jgi:hypothetical protein